MRLTSTIFKIGDKITVNGKIGEIVYVNRQLKMLPGGLWKKMRVSNIIDVVEKEK
jgi:hypothetical protein